LHPTELNERRKIRVLCVDDNEDIPLMLSRCIRSETDMEVAGVLHAADLLVEEVAKTKADVVLLDMNMPGKEPLDAVRELAATRRNGEGVRIIAFSGSSDRRAMDQATEAGVWGFVSKDEEVTVVLDAIREAANDVLTQVKSAGE
jgi:DNA-binding NarL/FixJ family response regulator